MLRYFLALVLAATLTACFTETDSDGDDGGGATDSGVDDAGTTDGGTDAGVDGGLDGGTDAGVDGGLDGGTDAGVDGGLDGGTDGGVDGGFDGGTDGGSSWYWPAGPEGYAFADLRYVSDFVIPPDDGTGGETCCRDWDAASANAGTDNAWAALARTVSGLGVDFQAMMDAMIQDGDVVVLLDTFGHPTWLPEERIVARFDASFDGVTYSQASQGAGSFIIQRSSFLPGSGEPAEWFDGTLSASLLDVAGPSFVITMPLLGAELPFVMEDARLVADDTAGEYLSGELSGYVTLENFYGAINDLVLSPACSCLGLAGPVYVEDAVSGDWNPDCISDTSACTDPSTAACVSFASSNMSQQGTCGLLGLMINPDIDTDGDTNDFEAISVGLEWMAVPTVSATIEP